MLGAKHESSYIRAMNELDAKTRAQILAMLCEGASMRSVSRLTDTSINTVSTLLVDAGHFCAWFHGARVSSVKARRVQVDEIWSFTTAKEKNVATMKAPVDGAGDTWTWTAIEADTKLLISHFVGGRDGECAKWFIEDMASRITNRIQLTCDGHKAYLETVEGAFGADIEPPIYEIDECVLEKVREPCSHGCDLCSLV